MKGGLSTALKSRLRAHLVIARVADLPSVWSNCVAAWALAVGRFLPTLAVMIVALPLIHIGAMYLNNAWNALTRPGQEGETSAKRGPAGRYRSFIIALVFLGAGLFLVWGEGWPTFAMAVGLTGVIVAYDVLNARVGWSPFLMALYHAMIYFTIAVASTKGVNTNDGINTKLLLWALALAVYVVALSFVARGGKASFFKRYPPLVLMLFPPILNCYEFTAQRMVFSLLFILWLLYSLYFLVWPKGKRFNEALGALIAGICLVDLLAVSQLDQPVLWMMACGAFFILGLNLRKRIGRA